MSALTVCKRCGKQMWAGPPDEPQRPCWSCQQAESRAKSATCRSCGGTGYVTGEYRFPGGRVHRQTEPCGDCRAR